MSGTQGRPVVVDGERHRSHDSRSDAGHHAIARIGFRRAGEACADRPLRLHSQPRLHPRPLPPPTGCGFFRCFRVPPGAGDAALRPRGAAPRAGLPAHPARIPRRAHDLLARRERRHAPRGGDRGRRPEPRPRPQPGAPILPGTPMGALPLLRHRGAGLSRLPVGQLAPRDRRVRALRRAGWPPAARRAPAPSARRLPDALARLPYPRRVGRGEAAARRPELARSHRHGDLLRDRAASHLDRLVGAPDAALGAPGVRRLRLRGRARPAAPHLGAAPPAGGRLCRHGRHAGHRPRHRQLRLLQLPLPRARALGAGRRPLRPRRRAARAGSAAARPAHRRAGPGGALGGRVPPLPAPAGRPRGPPPARAPRARTLPLHQLLPSLRAHDARAPRGRDRGLRGRRGLAALRVPLQARRPRAAAALRRPAPAAGRLPALVPAPRPAARRALLRRAARPALDGSGGGGAALRPRRGRSTPRASAADLSRRRAASGRPAARAGAAAPRSPGSGWR